MYTSPFMKPLACMLAISLLSVGCQKQSDNSANPTESEAEVINTTDHHIEDSEGHQHEDHSREDHDHVTHNHHSEDHSHDVDEHGHNHEGHHHEAMSMTPYECEPRQMIEAHYADTSDLKESTHLLIEGIEYDLTPMIVTTAASNTKIYQTDIGITEGSGMVWQVDGDKGVLLNKTLDGNVPVEKEKVLFTCYELQD